MTIALRKLWKMGFFLMIISLTVPCGLSAADFRDIADELLAGENLEVFQGRNVALISGKDPVSTDFAVSFQNKLKSAGATVVFSDQKVIQKEIDRQMSGLVDDEEITAIGHEKGAEIVIQLILCRIPDNTKIKIMMIAAYVETNTLAASGVAIQNLDPPYDKLARDLPLQNEDAVAAVRKKTLALVEEKTSGVHDDPMPEPFSFPSLDFIKENAYWGANINILGFMGNLWGAKISLVYGRFGDTWGLWDRLCFELSPLFMNSGFGFDLNVGYRLWHYGGVPANWRFLFGSIVAAAGCSIVPNDFSDVSSVIPYIEIRGNFIVNVSLRFSPVNPYFGLQIGLGFHHFL